MADDDSDKTEEASAQKLSKAREEGSIPKSTDLNSGVMLLVGTLALALFGARLMGGLKDFMAYSFGQISTFQFSAENTVNLIYFAVQVMGFGLLPIALIMLVAALVVNIAQVGLYWSFKPIQPKFGKLFKLSNFVKMFKKDTFVELIKNILKMVIVGVIAYRIIRSRYEEALFLIDQDVMSFILFLLTIAFEIAMKCAILLVVLGLMDLIYKKRKHRTELKMTKQEVKDEAKQAEGDPKVKGKIKGLMQQMHAKMMMNELPKATVVVTNPVFIAIAIKYERGVDVVPVIVAKGKRLIAMHIRDVAQENNIPIVEDKALARGMYDVVEIGQEIPAEFFNAIAEVLAYVFNLDKKNVGGI
jgi:flagellar biosynthesis protein FlhB